MTPQQADSLRAILDTVFAAPDYRWVQRPEPLAALRRAWLSVKDWFQHLHEANPLIYHLILYGLLMLTLALVLHAAWTFFAGVRSADPLRSPAAARTSPHNEAWYRREADRLARSGRFAEAVQADFLALILALDARQVLRFHPSKTPGEYARESTFAAGPREEFRELVRRLYRYAFARSPCGPDEFADWRARAVPERYAPAN